MFSPSVLGGSICLRCQIRAVARRAPPLLAAAPIRGRRRQCASDATTSRPADLPPTADIKEHGREMEQRPDGSRQPQPDVPSPSVDPEQTLSDPPRDALGNALDLPERGVTDNHTLSGIERNAERDQISRADVDPPERALTSEPQYRIQDRADGWKTDQGKNLSVGQPQQDYLSKAAGAPANRTYPHCRKDFPSLATRDDHTKQGCVSLKPPRDLKCPKCGNGFGTKKLLHRHLAKSSCSGKAKPEKLAGNEDGRKIENILTRAAAEFSRNQASGRGNSAIADDWSLPPLLDVHPRAAPAGREPEKFTGEDGVVGMEDNTKTESDIKDEKADTVGKKATIQESTARVRDIGNEKQAEKDFDDSLIRKVGVTTRGWKKEHRRGAMLLVEDASKLGVDSLGKAAEVIVLRDGRQWERRARPVEANSEKVADDGLKMEDFLDEQDDLSLEDVVKNIHGLKPERQIVSARKYKSLFNTLLSGFTILQLEKYVVWYREQRILETIKDEVFGEAETSSDEPTIPADVLPKSRQCAWMIEEAHWTPYVDGAVEEVQYPLSGYIMKSMPPKQRLVVQLVRECWGMSIRELMDGNGRVDIRVRDLEFKLLTREYSTVETSPCCVADSECSSRFSIVAAGYIATLAGGGTADRSSTFQQSRSHNSPQNRC